MGRSGSDEYASAPLADSDAIATTGGKIAISHSIRVALLTGMGMPVALDS